MTGPSKSLMERPRRKMKSSVWSNARRQDTSRDDRRETAASRLCDTSRTDKTVEIFCNDATIGTMPLILTVGIAVLCSQSPYLDSGLRQQLVAVVTPALNIISDPSSCWSLPLNVNGYHRAQTSSCGVPTSNSQLWPFCRLP
jgi:hypothetical protein